ncbi:MAG: hypothetical protein ABMA64_07125 [Myxococcota bacterium]
MSGFGRFALRCVLAHTATYLVAGLAALTLGDYASWWDKPEMAHYRPMDSPWVALGPALQVVRGLVFAAVLWPVREPLVERPGSVLRLWALLVGVGVLSTYAAAIGSIEGAIYTDLPLVYHLFGLPEVIGQAGAFSLCLVGSYRWPHRAWELGLGLVSALAVAAGVLGVLFG